MAAADKPSPVLYILLGLGVLLGLAGLGLSGLAWQTVTQRESERDAAVQNCLVRLRTLGSAEQRGGSLRLEIPDVRVPQDRIEDASALAAVCPGWTVGYFCMGSACADGPAVKMIVELVPRR